MICAFVGVPSAAFLHTYFSASLLIPDSPGLVLGIELSVLPSFTNKYVPFACSCIP